MRDAIQPGMRRRKQDKYAWIAALTLVLAALTELTRVFILEPTTTFTFGHSATIAIGLTVLWLSAAVVLVGRFRSATWGTVAWLLSIAAVLSMVAHALVTRIAYRSLPIPYLPAAILLVFLIKKTFEEDQKRGPQRAPGRAMPAGQEPYASKG